jgi:hypothetical protein
VLYPFKPQNTTSVLPKITCYKTAIGLEPDVKNREVILAHENAKLRQNNFLDGVALREECAT